jgi:predicted dehydrogenase
VSEHDPVRIGVVGAAPYGFGARAHIPGILAASGLELIAVATAHDETARAAAALWNVPRWYGSIDALLECDDIEAVTIAVRPRLHHRLTMAALEAGKAVYCEWPLALNTPDAVELAAAAAGRGLTSAVGLQGRWQPEMRYLRDLVAAGRIGRPLSFDIGQALDRFEVPESRSWLHSEEEASGALFVASAHVIDAVRFVLGEVESLSGLRAALLREDAYADTGNPFTWEASDTVRYVARLESGVVGSLAVSNITSPPLGFVFRIFGDGGRLEAMAPGYYQFTPMRLAGASTGREPSRIRLPERYRSDIDLEEGHAGANVGSAIAAFGAAHRSGERFRPDFADGVGLHRIIDAVVQSSDEGTWATVERPERE